MWTLFTISQTNQHVTEVGTLSAADFLETSLPEDTAEDGLVEAQVEENTGEVELDIDNLGEGSDQEIKIQTEPGLSTATNSVK